MDGPTNILEKCIASKKYLEKKQYFLVKQSEINDPENFLLFFLTFGLTSVKNETTWRMLKAPPLISSVLHFSVLQNRPDRGPLIC